MSDADHVLDGLEYHEQALFIATRFFPSVSGTDKFVLTRKLIRHWVELDVLTLSGTSKDAEVTFPGARVWVAGREAKQAADGVPR